MIINDVDGAINQVRNLFVGNNIRRTLNDVLGELPQFEPSQVSMALKQLHDRRWLSRELVESLAGNRLVYAYTYHPKRLPHPDRKPLFIAVNPITYYAEHPVLNKPDRLDRWESKSDPAE